MFVRLFKLLRDGDNRAVLGWIGGGLVVVVPGVWAVFTYFNSPDPEPRPSPSVIIGQNVQAGRDVTINPTVMIGADEKKLDALPDVIVEKLLAKLDARGVAGKAQEAGLERNTIIALARRLKPEEALDFDRAVIELENAVTIALDVIARGERASNEGEFIDGVLARVAQLTREGRFDEGAGVVDTALAELERRETGQREAFGRRRVLLLEAGIEQDILRRDAPAAARRIEAVAAALSDERPIWSKTFIEYQDRYYVEGDKKGVNFSLEIAILLARRMSETARDVDERGNAANLLGNALWALGERESGTARLEAAVTAYGEALQERTRARVPLDWAMTQNNLGAALEALGQRESGTARLEQAVAAYTEALQEYTSEAAPYYHDVAQGNLARAQALLDARRKGQEK